MQDEDEIVIENSVAEALPDNYEEFDHELDPAKFGDKLVQENTLKGTVREYQIYASKYLLLSFIEGKKAAEKKFRINLTYISPEPEHKKVIVWNWLYGALAAAVLFGLFILFAVKEVINLEYCLLGGAISLTIAAICTLIFIYLMRDEYIFKSQFGNIDLFLIDNGKPNQKDFDQFFIVLQQIMDKSQSEMSVANRLVDELKMCRRLKDEMIIDEPAYTAARTAIFKNKQYQS